MTEQGTMRDFIKMHGLGNDFIVFDCRQAPLRLEDAQVRALADRKTGIGCDQLITLLPDIKNDTFMRIQNADGEEVDACGNATRCVGALLLAETGAGEARVNTNAGVLVCTPTDDPNVISVDMGTPQLDWQAIPVARETDTVTATYSHAGHVGPGLVNVGNPHAVFFVEDAEAVDVARIGPKIETDTFFPERTNVEFASLIEPGLIRMRVWERGVGITRACGTGACATMVAASRRGLVERAATIRLDGGDLQLHWDDNDHIVMTGPVATSFHGQVAL
jgi:diaminopimelate epimerase